MTGVDIFRENNFGLIILNDPSVHNALKIVSIAKIRSVLQEWKSDNLSGVVITGTGKTFCSGLSINELENKLWTKNPISLLCDDIDSLDCPVICALNGSVFGGAVEIALSCDFRVASRNISVVVPAAKLGIQYEPSGIQKAINILGPSITRRLFLLGETIHTNKLIETDFVDFWVETPQTVFEKAKEIILTIEQNAPLAVGGMKTVISQILNNTLDQKAAFEKIQECFDSYDHKEALLARKEKRSPVFKGS